MDKPDVQGDDVDNFEFGGGEMDMGGMDFGGNGDELNLEDDLPELNQVRFIFLFTVIVLLRRWMDPAMLS